MTTPLSQNPRFRLACYLTIDNPVMSCRQAIPMVNAMTDAEVEAELKLQEEKLQATKAHGRINAGLQLNLI